MPVFNRQSTLRNAIDDWRARGLIDPATAETLNADLANQPPARSFQSIIILLGVICLGFGAVTFVAANWEEMTRLTRVGLTFGTLIAAWVAAGVFQARGHPWLAQSFVLLACAFFGAGIMLVSQIYHIQGEPKDATWLWAMGTLLAAACTASVPALGFAVMLITVWTFLELDLFRNTYDPDFAYLIYLAICAALARWLKSRFVGHLILLGLGAWTLTNTVFYIEEENGLFFAAALFASFATISAALWSEGGRQWFLGFERSAMIYVLLTLGGLMLIWYAMAQETRPEEMQLALTYAPHFGVPAVLFCTVLAFLARSETNENTYDLMIAGAATLLALILQVLARDVPFLLEAYLLAFTIWVIRMGWRLEYRPVTVLGFIGFAGMMMLIYFVTIGTLIGTAAFYLVAGISLLAGVFIVPRMMRKPEGES
ncbi:MAG: DUF2157 domain-containing protein [Rhodobacteraceae bacterium]|nr:DUF2157 domain-containing protein [Paracoccaceae bacterium]